MTIYCSVYTKTGKSLVTSDCYIKLIRPASIVSMVLDLYCCCIYFVMSVYVKLLRCDVYGGVYYPNPDVEVTMPYFTGVVNPLMFTGAPIQIK